ncbi:MAG: hypothetical protein CM15mP81_09210 [Alphaproteobacteria bacterium]|nr:MAG: hypothetical protein CM15mP81_09210 [Alphaproteobacteria bacterium]
MPNTLFLIAGFGAALASFLSRRSETIEEEQELEKLSAPEENESEEKLIYLKLLIIHLFLFSLVMG